MREDKKAAFRRANNARVMYWSRPGGKVLLQVPWNEAEYPRAEVEAWVAAGRAEFHPGACDDDSGLLVLLDRRLYCVLIGRADKDVCRHCWAYIFLGHDHPKDAPRPCRCQKCASTMPPCDCDRCAAFRRFALAPKKRPEARRSIDEPWES
jgi:hypothetical protein